MIRRYVLETQRLFYEVISMTVRRFRIILDVALMVVMTTLFSKDLFGIGYHEVVGTAGLALILLHIAVDRKIFIGMAKALVKVPLAIKACFVVDVLLIASFVALGVSGFAISRVIFDGAYAAGPSLPKLMHFFVGGAAVILLGLHIGLHICRVRIKRAAAVAMTAIFVALGAWGAAETNVGRWLSIPFSSPMPPREAPAAAPDERAERPRSARPRERVAPSAIDRAAIIARFFGMIAGTAMITYWIARPKVNFSAANGAEMK